MNRNVLVLKHFESPKEAGVYFRLVCLTGSNKGESYVLVGNRIIIGRSEKADIKIVDNKASREHAEITRVGEKWVVTDLGSQNGVMINDTKITQMQLNESDKLIIGHSVFKFAKVEVASREKVIKEDTDEEKNGTKSMTPLLFLAAVLAGLYLMEDDPENKIKKQASTSNMNEVSNEYITALKKRQASEDKILKKNLEVI